MPKSETFTLDLADNIYGIHHITTASGKVYELTIRDFQDRNGYCTCPDFRTNKLGTCKHLLFAQREIIRTLPVTAGERATAKRAYVVTWAALYPLVGVGPVLARVGDPLPCAAIVAGGVVAAIALAVATIR